MCFACVPVSTTVHTQIEEICRPYLFDINGWEARVLLDKLKPAMFSHEDVLNENTVHGYFERTQIARRGSELIDAEESRSLERTLQVWISCELIHNGITSPLADYGPFPVMFPPLLLKVEQLPTVLVVSPRERIELIQRATLRSELSPLERNGIETKCDKLGVSSLVDDIAGIATFPAMVTPGYGIRNTLSAASEEWLHQYLAFTPLGFRYLEVIAENSDPDMVASLNETLVGMVSEEITDSIMAEHFPETAVNTQGGLVSAGFSFRSEMRLTRLRTDELLSAGDVEGAERYMNERRQIFMRNGYYLRKLNQAYFAFHGTYGTSPASSNPVHESLKKWRQRCGSMKEFFISTSRMTGYKSLQEALSNS
jgi:hypothetical protein